MKRIIKMKSIWALMALLLVVSAGESFAQTKKKPVLKKKTVTKKTVKPATPVYKVDTGTVIRARMNKTISSKTAVVGNTFTVTVTEPVYSNNGIVVIPTGSTITGRVDSVKKAGKEGKPGEIDASFISVRLPNGRTRAINGSLTELTEGGTKSDDEGTATGKKMGNRKLIFIGGGAAGGAVLGAAIGGGKGALIGGAIGAAGGFLGDRFIKGNEAEVKSGTEFGVYLNQAISLPKFVETTPVNP